VGVAGALCLGVPGSIFWMWVCGFVGMATKYAEATLAVHYRKEDSAAVCGGPMYVISNGMGKNWKWLSLAYCFLGIFAAFGVGNATQINAMLGGIRAVTGWEEDGWIVLLGMMLALLVGLLLSGGARRVGALAEKLMPAAAGGYILLCVIVLILRSDRIAASFASIFRGAFHPEAVTGGALGSAFCTLRTGCARGVFTNEAGMGTAGIAHAQAEVDHPAQQGMMGIMEVFLDTMVICTLTALVILCSGIRIPYGVDAGSSLTGAAFSAVCGKWVNYFLTGAVCCFAIAAVLGWGLYAQSCAVYLLGHDCTAWFVCLQMAAAFLGAVLETKVVWTISEVMNALMALPNLICLCCLSQKTRELTDSYLKTQEKLKKT
jgi:AGCS family alanine or glycine:cation symporter